ncbi:nuclear transport factor 2 family protein [Nocardioides mesophilus]|uniref:Nuclear transport factor 2 family protein n=1 Tax=Nocardioides mesophilus TaxID=433659 RepID=A0A7G9RD35_9ACTN|nr:nuclear transport factor 2 family protein [Nocardioides mesophilus]QNN53510.1 nuclear transport factor 2 family protein [Nocardioides mesophilus]
MKTFREAVETRDAVAVEALLAEDVVFRSPAVHKPYQGKQATAVILRAVMRVFEDFRYTRVVEDGSDHVLVFEARVGGRDVEGADFLHVDEDGRIDDFRVMVRPLSGLNALVEAMGVAIPEVMAELGLS